MSELVYYRNLEEQLLVFPILGQNVGIELKYVKSISLTTELIPIPRSPKYLLGIVNIDSNIFPVVDMDILLSGKNSPEINQTIISLIDIKSTTFGVHTQRLPNVVPGAVGETQGNADKIPEEWIIGYTDHPELGTIPIINPKKFWVDMGESEVSGPLLNTEMTAADLHPDDEEMIEVEETIDQMTDHMDKEEEEEEEEEIAAVENIEPEAYDEMVTAVEDIETDDEVTLAENTSDDNENEIFQIEGIGEKIKQDLLEAGFDTIEKLANANIDDLTVINGVGKKTAENITISAKDLLQPQDEDEEQEK